MSEQENEVFNSRKYDNPPKKKKEKKTHTLQAGFATLSLHDWYVFIPPHFFQ